jgi:CRP-like cAMP-binding protein
MRPPTASDPGSIEAAGNWLKLFRDSEERFACDAGFVVYREGSPAGGVYLLHEGAAELRLGVSPRQVSAGIVSAGDLFGLQAALTTRVHDETAIVVRQSVLGFLPLETMLELFAYDRDFRFELLRRLSAGNEKLTHQIVQQRRTHQSARSSFHFLTP